MIVIYSESASECVKWFSCYDIMSLCFTLCDIRCLLCMHCPVKDYGICSINLHADTIGLYVYGIRELTHQQKILESVNDF